jgi:hypothetical protein
MHRYFSVRFQCGADGYHVVRSLVESAGPGFALDTLMQVIGRIADEAQIDLLQLFPVAQQQFRPGDRV